MKQPIYGIVGYKGKLGSLLVRRPNFVPIDCDITNKNSILKSKKNFDVVVNCAAVSSIDTCESEDRHAFHVNATGAEKLMEVYGDRVLNISSDYVFGGWTLFPPTEKSRPSPVRVLNIYGMTKIIMEDFSRKHGAKVLRLSRTVNSNDPDISQYSHSLYYGQYTDVPAFFYRNYLTRNQAVDGIEYAVRNFESIPSVVNYGSSKPVTFYELMWKYTKVAKLPTELLGKRRMYRKDLTPRPKKSGFSVGLAKKLGFPIYSLQDVADGLWSENV